MSGTPRGASASSASHARGEHSGPPLRPGTAEPQPGAVTVGILTGRAGATRPVRVPESPLNARSFVALAIVGTILIIMTLMIIGTSPGGDLLAIGLLGGFYSVAVVVAALASEGVPPRLRRINNGALAVSALAATVVYLVGKPVFPDALWWWIAGCVVTVAPLLLAAAIDEKAMAAEEKQHGWRR